jgi:hypothetical protein
MDKKNIGEEKRLLPPIIDDSSSDSSSNMSESVDLKMVKKVSASKRIL